MKLRCLLPALVWFCATLAASAQTFTDDLAIKRSNLQFQLRALGPLAPDSWPASKALVVFNSDVDLGQFVFHGVGRYAYIGNNGAEWFYRYAGTNLVFWESGRFANSSVQFNHFGLHDYEPTAVYRFVMDAASYNIAGLKYVNLAIIADLSANGIWPLYPGTEYVAPYSLYPFDPNRVLDLVQNVETPAFRVSDYWFGWWPNFPADPKVASPQDTQRQSAGAFLVANLNVQTPPLIGWAEEGVYRPGFALQPGYSTPRVNTFMQQYFGDAWKCDATTGTVPRTSTMNWNNVGRINTNTAVRTGAVNPTGYFTPSEPGKAILTTRPLEDGSYGELPIYTLAMFVDKNRDGTLDTNDVTTAASPHVFWVNNDYDRAVYSDNDLWDELDLPAATAGSTDASFIKNWSRIPSLRDLEDFDRLHIRGLKELCRDLPSGCTVGLRWKTVLSGNPGIYVFRAVESDGGRLYLTTNTVASAQIAPSTFPPPTGDPGFSPLAVASVEPGATSLFAVGSTTNDFFIYCGTSRGAGELAVTVSRSGQVVGEASVFLDLRDVKELYERWTVGEPPDATGAEPATTPSLFGGGLPAGVNTTAFLSDTNQPYILFVHGWNMSPDDKESFAETAFKRLYWQGYSNRFGAFRWPTAYNQGDTFTATADLNHFNRSELYAWKSGEPLRQLLVSLNQRYPGKTYVMAHSMGNIVAGEALALNAQKYGGGQIVNTYVASQAAVSLHAYSGSNANSAFTLNFQRPDLAALAPSFAPYFDQFGKVIGFSWFDFDSNTPNIHRDWLNTNAVSCARRVNFYNANDWALSATYWEMNQMLKPGLGYRYVSLPPKPLPRMPSYPGQPPTLYALNYPTFTIPSPARKGLTASPFRPLPGYFQERTGFFSARMLDWEYNLNDMYEATAFGSESRVKAIGASWDVNTLDERLNLHTTWPTDMEVIQVLGEYGRHKWHSAQFRMSNMQQSGYWQALLGLDGFRIKQ